MKTGIQRVIIQRVMCLEPGGWRETLSRLSTDAKYHYAALLLGKAVVTVLSLRIEYVHPYGRVQKMFYGRRDPCDAGSKFHITSRHESS